MKTKYKWIHFEKGDKVAGEHWTCHNNKNGVILGDLMVHIIWNTYCFFPTQDVTIALSSDCCRDIADFLEQLNKERGKDEKRS